jgi:hypothetical protein
MVKRRKRRLATRGRYRRKRPSGRIITPDYQRGIPYKQRRKLKVLEYPDWRIITRTIRKPSVQTPIKSSMVKLMNMAMFRRSHFKRDEITKRRCGTVDMNDNWRSWDREYWARKRQIASQIHPVQLLMYLTDLPRCTCIQQSSVS